MLRALRCARPDVSPARTRSPHFQAQRSAAAAGVRSSSSAPISKLDPKGSTTIGQVYTRIDKTLQVRRARRCGTRGTVLRLVASPRAPSSANALACGPLATR